MYLYLVNILPLKQIILEKTVSTHKQWRNRRGGGGGGGEECPPPETSDREISADVPGKKRHGKNGKVGNRKEKKENCKGEGKKSKMGGESSKMRGEDLFFLHFSLFKTSEICFGSTKIENFLTGEKNSRREKNQEK